MECGWLGADVQTLEDFLNLAGLFDDRDDNHFGAALWT
jgi:hypothetical protein